MAPGPDAATTFRYRVCFGKQGLLRFTSHLDLLRSWERLLRRARVPLLYSQGFHPRPKLQLFSALPLGYTSEAELIDVFSAEALSLELLKERLVAAAPPGIAIGTVAAVPATAPAVDRDIRAAVYEVQLPDDVDRATLRDRVAAFLTSPTCPRTRREKAYDLRPLVLDLELVTDGSPVLLRQTLSHHPTAIGRADELLLALDLDPLACLIHRQAFLFSA